MQDQHFMQQWNAGHDRFSEGLDHAFANARRSAKNGLRRVPPRKDAKESCLARKARLTGLAMIGGVLLGASLSMVAPLVVAIDCPQAPAETARSCAQAALA